MEQVITGIIIAFLVFQTINWFVLQAYRVKLDFQKHSITQAQAERCLLHIRLMYFWLLSDYYTGRMTEIYYLAYESPEVSIETVERMRRSMKRRMVRGLPKQQQKRVRA
ncbi:hypothetical protein [Niallia sp. Krafla_26]|uniref:hypothetical protein n=1 Tax=Niallia sp. Krafla_26 TaxID=3064703 RepID=UPI003D17A10F